jgi:hypothetical protein
MKGFTDFPSVSSASSVVESYSVFIDLKYSDAFWSATA